VRDALRCRGISTETISGDTPGRERGDIVARFHAGDIRCLTGCNVFTTGFDVPQIDLIAMLRPTLSTGLYVQMVGRGTRKAAGKVNCIVLDFAGNVRRHGPVDAPAIQRDKPAGERREGQGAAHVKVCPTCRTYAAPDITICPECGHQWSVRRRVAAHARSADNLAILSNAPPVRLAVAQVALHEHRRPDGGRPTLRIEYRTAAGIPYLEWLTLEHSGPAQRVAAYKWRQLGGRPPVPLTVHAAIERKAEITDQSIEIVVRHNGRHWSVIERSAQRRQLLVSA
jgi:DNA repair protein RadD